MTTRTDLQAESNVSNLALLARINEAEKLGWIAAGPRSTVSQSTQYFDAVFDLDNACRSIDCEDVQLALAHACIPHLEDSMRNISELDSYQAMHSWFMRALVEHRLVARFLNSSNYAHIGACGVVLAALFAERGCAYAKRDLSLFMLQVPNFDKPTGRSITMEMVVDAIFGTGTWLLYSSPNGSANTFPADLLNARLPFTEAIRSHASDTTQPSVAAVPMDLL